MFLKNVWYVAAWSNEVGRKLLSRQICEQPILLYRKQDGSPVAIGNMCPHRFAPLGRGKLIDDTVQCSYHGLRFGPDGRCVLNPHADGQIPGKMKVRSYPVAERHDMIWLWLGEPNEADQSAIPDFSCNTDPNFRRIDGVFEVRANYELVTDNLLDLTHAEFVHEGVLSSEAITSSKLQTHQAGSTIWSNRWCPTGDASPAWKVAFNNYDKPVDQWLYMRWDAPAHMLLDVGLTPVGKTRRDGIWLYGTDVLTPKDAFTTYYFWGFARNYEIHNPAVDDFWRSSIKLAFEDQDKPIIEAQQQMMGRRTVSELNPVMIAADTAATRARRTLEKLLQEERPGAVLRSQAEPPLSLLRKHVDSRVPVQPVV